MSLWAPLPCCQGCGFSPRSCPAQCTALSSLFGTHAARQLQEQRALVSLGAGTAKCTRRVCPRPRSEHGCGEEAGGLDEDSLCWWEPWPFSPLCPGRGTPACCMKASYLLLTARGHGCAMLCLLHSDPLSARMG